MSAVFSGNTPGASGQCIDFDLNAATLNTALEDANIVNNGLLELTRIDGSVYTNNIPYFSDFVITGLTLNISNVPVNRTLTYTAGTYQINAQVYSIPLGANFQLTAGHPTLPRIDILYLTNTNNIFYQTGTPSTTPVQPTPPAGTLLLAAIGVQINATTSLNYTLVTVNTNSTTIVPTTIANGTVTGSHLYWDGISWIENTFWNVSDSSFDPTARIHTYTETDSSGVVTTAKLGDSDIERGFYYLVNDVLNGYSTQMELSSSTGAETYFDLRSIDNNIFANARISNYPLGNEMTAVNVTNDRQCEFTQTDSTNVLEANLSVKDPTNYCKITQSINQILFETENGSTSNSFNFTNNFTSIQVETASIQNVINVDNTGIDLTCDNLTNTDAINLNLDLIGKINTLSITDGTNTCSFLQEPTNNTITTNTGYSRIESVNLTEGSRLDLYNNLTFLYNRNNPLTKNAEIQLNYLTGSLLKYEDSVTPTNNASINLFAGKTNINSGLRLKQRNTAISLTVVNDDYVIIVTAVPRTITLPLAPVDGETYIVKSNGVATGGNPITVSGNGKNIDSAATTTITTANGSVRVIFNNTLNKWFTI